MRYYVILNGVNSLTKQGLAINEMPPISKPLMRTQKEEIDGRDGDIITNLGYSAYDKELEIGLYGESYDINDIIAFFNGSGTVVFSDEPDKYYNYQIINQIDYEKLIKFKTATVVFHCQPFKYPLNEVPLEEEFEYVSGSGTNITLDNTAESTFNTFNLKGNTSQDGTPTPDSPINVDVVSGDNEINVCGKNIYNTKKYNFSFNQTTYEALSNILQIKNNYGGIPRIIETDTNYFKMTASTTYDNAQVWLFSNLQPNTNYNISCNVDTNITNGTMWLFGTARAITTKKLSQSFTTNASGEFSFSPMFYCTGTKASGNYIELSNIMLEKGSATTYEPYQGVNYPINLGVKNLWENQLTGFLPQSGSYPTTNSSYPNARYVLINLLAGQSITLSGSTSTMGRVRYIDKDTNQVIGMINKGETEYYKSSAFYTGQFDEGTITAKKEVIIGIMDMSGVVNNLVVNYGTTPQYISDNPIELCKIGDYQDRIYKNGNKWYIEKQIGKVILDGVDNSDASLGASTYGYYTSSNKPVFYLGWSNTNWFYNKDTIWACYCDNYKGEDNTTTFDNIYAYGNNSIAFRTQYPRLTIRDDRFTSLTDFKEWLSTHNTTVYYVLATPTTTEITDTELITQLNALEQANSQSGQTNISQVNSDLPFLLDVVALKLNSDHLIIDNIGNTYAKPTLDLEGTGIVDIYLNDIQMFQVDLSEVNEIVINTAEMEAYNPTTLELANRQVTGDYSNFKLAVGENDLRFSGNLTKATITNYKRWL